MKLAKHPGNLNEILGMIDMRLPPHHSFIATEQVKPTVLWNLWSVPNLHLDKSVVERG